MEISKTAISVEEDFNIKIQLENILSGVLENVHIEISFRKANELQVIHKKQ